MAPPVRDRGVDGCVGEHRGVAGTPVAGPPTTGPGGGRRPVRDDRRGRDRRGPGCAGHLLPPGRRAGRAGPCDQPPGDADDGGHRARRGLLGRSRRRRGGRRVGLRSARGVRCRRPVRRGPPHQLPPGRGVGRGRRDVALGAIARRRGRRPRRVHRAGRAARRRQRLPRGRAGLDRLRAGRGRHHGGGRERRPGPDPRPRRGQRHPSPRRHGRGLAARADRDRPTGAGVGRRRGPGRLPWGRAGRVPAGLGRRPDRLGRADRRGPPGRRRHRGHR